MLTRFRWSTHLSGKKCIIASQNQFLFVANDSPILMKKSLALIIGNSNYPNKDHKLPNAINDAEDIADKLKTLGFEVRLYTDCSNKGIEQAVSDFGSELNDYEIGLFYYAGHGLQFDNINYLTAIDTNFFDETSVPGTSYHLDRVIKYMNRTNAEVKILILDAYRENPFTWKYRSIKEEGLAPVHAPSGTLIAFSTSPGERAKDYGTGRNSIYTESLLKHIDDEYIPVEELFKRVRTSVSAFTNGKQTSWEHTSLIGDYFFNYGQRLLSVNLPYLPNVIKDKQYKSDNIFFGSIIEGLKSRTWDTQQSAIEDLESLNFEVLDTSNEFLLGRCILSAADGGCFAAQRIIDNIINFIQKFSKGAESHFLNGVLFEIYFNSNAEFRIDSIKNKYLLGILSLEPDSKYKPSFNFINSVIKPFSDLLFYIPGSLSNSVAIEIQFEKKVDENGLNSFSLLSIKHQGRDIYNKRRYPGSKHWSYLELKSQIAHDLGIPIGKLTISDNFIITSNDVINASTYLRLSKNINQELEEDL